jgi:hypothetical protein
MLTVELKKRSQITFINSSCYFLLIGVVTTVSRQGVFAGVGWLNIFSHAAVKSDAAFAFR